MTEKFKILVTRKWPKKVEEKFSYIINRLRYKRRKVLNFDFTCEKLTDWNILIENFNKENSDNFEIIGFLKYKVGEGIEIKKTDFSEEVKSLTK